MKNYVWNYLANELSDYSKYFDRVKNLEIIPDIEDKLFDRVPGKNKDSVNSIQSSNPDECNLTILNGTLNYHSDIQDLFYNLYKSMNRRDRIVSICYNSYFSWLYKIATVLKLRTKKQQTSFFTENDIENFCKLTNFEIVKTKYALLIPFWIPIVSTLINKIASLLPIIRNFSLVSIYMMRPVKKYEHNPKLSVVIPARNEEENLVTIIDEIQKMEDIPLEIIFVEGHSQDKTWDVIQNNLTKYKDKPLLDVKGFQQTGVGKNDAVKLGFENCTGEVITILDADKTVDPAELYKFYTAYRDGKGDFINGCRLVYPMETEAMRFLNLLGNAFFAKTVGHVSSLNISDSLCGTKMMAKKDHDRLIEWRKDFGDIDPFGDFDLLLFAGVVGLGSVDISIRYRSRTYGSTQISRFIHGFKLLQIVVYSFFKVKI